MKRYLISLLLPLFIILGGVLRFYHLDKNPPSLSWDEAAVGYNAFTLANWGRDEWGVKFPLVFKSFEDYKHPVHIYVTAIFVKLFGVSDFVVRLPSALFGLANILLIYLVATVLFRKRIVGVIASFLMAVSPYAIQFSRFNHELNFVVFFFLLGTYFFYLGIEKNKKFLPFAFLSFGVTLLTYHSAKVVALPLTLWLIFLYQRELWSTKKFFFWGLLIWILFFTVIIGNSQLLGLARIRQTSFSSAEAQQTVLYRKTKNIFLGRLEIVGKQYWWHFSPRYLFITGDKNPRHSTQVVGEFYKTDFWFMFVGLLFVIYQIIFKRKKSYLFLLSWILLSPLPSALVNEAPHAARAVFMLPGLILLSALGLGFVVDWLWQKRKWLAILLLLIVGSVYVRELYRYLSYYFQSYPTRYGIDWQYGMKEIAVVTDKKDIYSVFVTDERSQPYIFFLYNLRYSLPEFLATVEYNQTNSRSHSLVRSFGKYQFTDWDPIEAKPDDTTTYAVTPSQYSGLRNKAFFNWVDVISFPNGLDAFYLVSGKKEVELEE